MAALAVLWLASTREVSGIDWKVLTTATAWRHLSHYLWPEVHKWAGRVDWEKLGLTRPNTSTQLMNLQLKLHHGAASALASSDPVNLEGAHADSLLYVLDEAKAIPNGTWDAIEGAFSGGRTTGLPEAFALAISTPSAPAGRFYNIHKQTPGLEDWHPIHITLEDAINSGRISQEWAQQRAKQFGQESAVYQNRVLGEFAASDEDAAIPLSWIEAANERWHEQKENPPDSTLIIAVDVARKGGDETIIAHRKGPLITHLEPHNKNDTMSITAEIQKHLTNPETKAVIDTIGVGAGVYDRLKELEHRPIPFTGSAKTNMKDNSGQFGFTNVRSAALWNLRELLDPANEPDLALPPDDTLLGDLTAPTWTITTGTPPKIKIEPKEDLVKRLGRSPDRGDAVAMAYWADRARQPGPANTSAVAVFASTDLRAPRATRSSPFGAAATVPR